MCQPVASERAAVAAGQPRARELGDHWLVALLTIIAGVARLGSASVPTLWYDESQTFRRVCGTFAQLTAALRQDAFPPLHYYVYWLLGRGLGGAEHLTPFWMRFIPAVCGTLMVPVMWRLAGQLCGRRVALLVAALTACSSFLFAYSHDAKMYMPLWLLAAANVSAWISWVRAETHWKWLTIWLLTGIATVGYHATGLAVVGIEAAHAFTIRTPPRRAVLTAAGFALILLGPICYYTWCNNLVKSSQSVGWHTASGIGWLGPTDQGPGPLWRLYTTYLIAWNDSGLDSSRLQTGGHWFAQLQYTMATAGAVLLIATICGGIWLIIRLSRSKAGSTAAKTAFTTTFLLVFWTGVPIYVASRLSTTSPHAQLTVLAAGALLCFGAAALLLVKAAWPIARQRLEARGAPKPLIQIGASVAVVVVIAWMIGILSGALSSGGAESSSVWIPRYLAFVWPAFAILTCAGILALRPKPLRWLAIALLIGTNVAQDAAMVFAPSEPPVDRIADDVCNAAGSGGELRTYVTDRPPSSAGNNGGTISNSVGRYYLAIRTGNRLGPAGFFTDDINDFAPVRLWSKPADLAADVQTSPIPRQLIVWNYLPPDAAPALPDAPGRTWQLVENRIIPVRDHWTWRTLYFYRRAQYARRVNE